MLNLNDLNSYIIFGNSIKYDDINQRIIQEAKTYYKTMKNHSYQLTQIENKLNEYNMKSRIKIKQLLQKQQDLIKELINIINQLLSSKLPTNNNSLRNYIENDYNSKTKDNKNMNDKNINNFKLDIRLCNSIDKSKITNLKNEKINIKKYIKNKNLNKSINSVDRNMNKRNNPKNSTNKSIISLSISSLKSLNESKNNQNCINIKCLGNKNNKFKKKYLNKQQIKKEIENTNKKLIKSVSSSEISNKSKNKNNNIYLKINCISNSDPYNRNYTIDEEGNNISFNYEQERQPSLYNRTEVDGSLPNLLAKPKLLKHMKYRSAKKIPLKEEFYLINNYTFTNYNITNSSSNITTSNLNHRNNSSLTFLNKKLNNIFRNNHNSKRKLEKQILSMPYINNGIQINPTRMTKEVLSSSYKVLNKYKNKRYKNMNK